MAPEKGWHANSWSVPYLKSKQKKRKKKNKILNIIFSPFLLLPQCFFLTYLLFIIATVCFLKQCSLYPRLTSKTLCSIEWSQVVKLQHHAESLKCQGLNWELPAFWASSLHTGGHPSPLLQLSTYWGTPLHPSSNTLICFSDPRTLNTHSPWYNNSAFKLRLNRSYSLSNEGISVKGGSFSVKQKE